jgi:hypothetical protein
MGNSWFSYRKRMHTLLISNGLRTNKLIKIHVLRDILHGVLQVCGEYLAGGWYVSHWHEETPRIGIRILGSGVMNGHSILDWILRFSNG